jgi:FkbM family methyltransferase
MTAKGQTVFHVSAPILMARALRRRLWRVMFARPQRQLGSFFLDASDYLGAERLILGSEYEHPQLSALDLLITKLRLGDGAVLDVGANIGNHSRWLVDRFKWVECVEPGRLAALVLEANLFVSGKSNWRVHRCALGRQAGHGELEVDSTGNLGASRVRQADSGRIPIRTGDSIWAARGVATGDLELIKIDVEGWENEVVEGLENALAEYHPMLCIEVLAQSRWTSLHTKLCRMGYQAFLAIEAANDRKGFSRWLSFLTGLDWRLVPISEPFRAGGYEMVICLGPEHASRLAEATADVT